jgi:nicotinamide-nucleotide amidase
MQCDIAIATTGNAGPLKGDSDAEVGTAVIVISTENGCESHVFYLGNHRTRITEKAINKGLELLYAEILNNADINL